MGNSCSPGTETADILKCCTVIKSEIKLPVMSLACVLFLNISFRAYFQTIKSAKRYVRCQGLDND